ncbi:MAG: glucosylceramidase, partial [Candidatus Omnitrophica bacterium]|nr:glucosylceramidase [Candidatus Omnitrophota bacterium]
GYIYPEDKVRSSLESIWKYNWTPDVTAQNKAHPPLRWFISPGEAGIFTCTWPKSKHLSKGVLYKNEVWTGIEYQVAGHMVAEGKVQEALVICRAVHDRYAPGKHNPWNEVECGDHYARGMASWGVYLSLLGFQYHGPKGILTFDPKLNPEDFRAAFTTAKGWGTYSRTIGDKGPIARIDLQWGELELNQLTVPTGEAKSGFEVTLNGRRLPAQFQIDGDFVEIEFPEGLRMKAGEGLELTV